MIPIFKLRTIFFLIFLVLFFVASFELGRHWTVNCLLSSLGAGSAVDGGTSPTTAATGLFKVIESK